MILFFVENLPIIFVRTRIKVEVDQINFWGSTSIKIMESYLVNLCWKKL